MEESVKSDRVCDVVSDGSQCKTDKTTHDIIPLLIFRQSAFLSSAEARHGDVRLICKSVNCEFELRSCRKAWEKTRCEKATRSCVATCGICRSIVVVEAFVSIRHKSQSKERGRITPENTL